MKKYSIKALITDAPENIEEEIIREDFLKISEEIAEYATRLYAEGKQSLLCIFQGMDASGKDGTCRKVFRNVTPTMLKVSTFGKPTDIEMKHDFLWRVHQAVPAKGETGVFLRSHYEDVLIQRVHQWISEETAKQRFEAINRFEEHLTLHNNTTILKFFMNISSDKQLEKLQERKDDVTKNWKHREGDWEERKHWNEYMKCYEDVLNKCNKIPWNVIPSDKRWYRDYSAGKIILNTLKKMDPQYPKLS